MNNKNNDRNIANNPKKNLDIELLLSKKGKQGQNRTANNSPMVGEAQRFKEFTQGAELIMKNKQSEQVMAATRTGNATTTTDNMIARSTGVSRKLVISKKLSKIVN